MADDTEYRQIVYRLLPGTREKARRLAALAGACRFVWNAMLDQQKQLDAAARLAEAERQTPPRIHRKRSSGAWRVAMRT